MGFWDSINSSIEKVFGGNMVESTDPTGLPSGVDLSGPDPFANALASAESLSPDGNTPAVVTQAPGSDPFGLNASQLVSIQGLSTQPFTVIDLDPSNSSGTRGYGTGQTPNVDGKPLPGAGFSVPNGTLKQIANALNTQGLMVTANQLASGGAFPIGQTFTFSVTGKTLKIEQLPMGGGQFLATFGAPLVKSVNTSLLPNDVWAQRLLALFLNGLFVQFESPDAPVFIAKPGEIYQLPFTKIFVTCFGAGARWRLIAGNNANIDGYSDLRQLKQQLHLWDGAGLFDNPMVHPVPFSVTMTGQASGATVAQSLNVGTNCPNLFSNYDSGANLAQQAGGAIVGTVNNKGYKILWITGIRGSISLSNSQNIIVSLFKTASFAPGTYNGGSIPEPLLNLDTLYYDTNYGPSTGPYVFSEKYAKPKRLVLAGFDTIQIGASGSPASGETTFFSFTTPGSGQLNSLTIDGYYWPSLVPFNPYPMDFMFLDNQI